MLLLTAGVSTRSPNAAGGHSPPVGFLPPTWTDLIPFLQASAIIWLCILVISILRSEIYTYFRSTTFRQIVKRAKERGRTSGPLLRAAKLFRAASVRLERNRLPESDTSIYFGYPRCLAGLFICIAYMFSTYTHVVPLPILYFQTTYGVVIAANLLVQHTYAERPILFALSLSTIVDCLSIPTLVSSSRNQWLNFNFLQAYAVLVEWSLLEKHDIVLQNLSALMRLCYNMFFQIVCFLYITSCGVQFFELLGELPLQALRSETYQITWANAVYFAVVTLMTVGYGDFVPYTFLGRMWVVFHIIFAAVLVSRGISLLIDALQTMRRGAGSYVAAPGAKHVVVTGRVKWEFLRQFVIEFLEEPSNLGTRVIILAVNPDWSEDEWNRFVDQKPLFNHHLVYLEGSALKIDDLHRAHVHTARGVFVLADPHREDPYKEDSDILKSVLTIRNYSGTVPVFTLNILNESSFQFGIALEHILPNAELQHMRNSGQGRLPASSTFFGLPYNSTAGLVSNATTQYTLDENGRDADSGVERGARKSLHSPEGSGDSNGLDMPPFQSGDWLGVGEGGQSSDTLRVDPSGNRSAQKQRSSVSLCMQELETVLLSENIFCNGLSTLIANATLRVAPQSHSKDRPWLMEYKLGAECSVQKFDIRKEMDGMTIEELATVLQDYGLVLLAVRERDDHEWKIATTEVRVRKGMKAMSLSYHDNTVVDRIADHAAALFYERDVMRQRADSASVRDSARMSGDGYIFEETPRLSRPIYQPVPGGPRSIFDDPENDEEPSSSAAIRGTIPSGNELIVQRALAPLDRSATEQQGERPSLLQAVGRSLDVEGTPGLVQAVAENPMSLRSVSETVTKGDKEVLDEKGVHRGGDSDRIDDSDSDDGLGEIPRLDVGVGSSPHPRLADQGSSRKLRRDGWPNSRRRATQRVYSAVERLPAALRGHVIICVDGETSLMNLDALLRRICARRPGCSQPVPIVVIHPRFPKSFSRRLGGDQSGLFLLQGNSLSLSTLKQAQYQTARAFLILASETKEESGQGSTDSKAIFTVMALDSLLAGRNMFVCCVLDAEASLQLLRSPKEPRRVGMMLRDNRDGDSLTADRWPQLQARTASSASLLRTARLGSLRNIARLGGGNSTGGGGSSASGGREMFGQSRSRSRASGLRTMGMTRSSSMRVDAAPETSEDEDDEYQEIGGVGGTRLRDSERSEKRAREERYERQRYASGEMMISSLFTSLLAREYTDSGYIRLIRQLIGASSGSNGSWIRQVGIPELWMSVEKAIGGRTYRELSTKLLQFGCVALGLYRSGDAPVRAEIKSELWMRGVDEVVYLERGAGENDDDEIEDERGWTPTDSMSSILMNNRGDDAGGQWYGAAGRYGESASVERVSFAGGLPGLADDADEFDRMTYTCPSTRRRIFYKEVENGENVLPYVYSCPEPYTAVAATDLVFVLCHPQAKLPTKWEDDDGSDEFSVGGNQTCR